ncbi:unnamed protein product [Medioppia subpectinata]|uniref:Transglutaminase N-terminal domain-containing protein n=1 Tax=Medioppia subpectinata TaxID=1979941 RepID=A0A7R9Q356_9ACAR|nr:unnamed protein product [Medioppia subpectinata]CAG2110166.1 unnamed protein product [Medioppia subpectinata]
MFRRNRYRIRCDRMGNCLAWLRPSRVRLTPANRYRSDDRVISSETNAETYNSSYAQSTRITIPVFDDRNPSNVNIILEDEWSAKVVKVDGFNVSIEISSAPTAIIGEYTISVETKSLSKGNRSLQANHVSESIYLLFNPWNKRDSVFLKDRDGREEYVLNESGIIWRGTHEKMKPTPWNFAQFDEYVLEASLYALSKVGRLSVTDRADPIKVCRHISAIVNSVDDNGIMVGNWKEDFDATPQEPSDGLYRCGPTSVEAIKQGEVNRHFDGKFVYAEVNADEYYAMDDFRLRMPDIIIQIIGDIIQGKPFTCNVYFINPLPRSLTKGVFTIEGPDYSNRLRMPLKM